MICINESAIPGRSQGRAFAALLEAFPRTGVLPCCLFSFDGGGEGDPHGKRPKAWLESRPIDEPLVLIAMADRYEAGEKTGHRVVEHKELTPEAIAAIEDHAWRDAEWVCRTLKGELLSIPGKRLDEGPEYDEARRRGMPASGRKA